NPGDLQLMSSPQFIEKLHVFNKPWHSFWTSKS
ncbi:unnamed protein product, partial [marine sediment metagenome]